MYPRSELRQTGSLDRPDGAQIYWEAAGAPEGKPALYLHGGPGGGLGSGNYRRYFDPERYLVVGMDQRGCGRSRPLAAHDLASLSANTTQALVADIEALRVELGIESWLVCGVSWGTTLALAYALEYPNRVSELTLMAVTTTSCEEVEWISDGVGAIFPEARAELRERVDGDERVVDVYARLLTDPDARVRQDAADAWDRWEMAHMSLSPFHGSGPLHDSAEERLNFATLVVHYWSQDAFLSEPILDRVADIAHIPAVLIHGRLDVSGPVETAWRLHQEWPKSQLFVVEDEGHGGPEMARHLVEALDAFAL